MPTSLFDPVYLGCRPVADIMDIKTAQGLRFVANYSETHGTSTVVSVIITTPATGTYHVRGIIQVNDEATWTFSKDPDASGGTAITAYNTNQAVSTLTTLTHTSAPTYVSAGTVMRSGAIGSYMALASIGGFNRGGEWILSPSTIYLIRVTGTASTMTTIVDLDYYRES